jgi:hypothetical protein
MFQINSYFLVLYNEIKFYNHKDISKIINTCRQKPKHQSCKKRTINKYVEGILRMVSEFKKYDCQGEIEIKFEDMFTFTILVHLYHISNCMFYFSNCFKIPMEIQNFNLSLKNKKFIRFSKLLATT